MPQYSRLLPALAALSLFACQPASQPASTTTPSPVTEEIKTTRAIIRPLQDEIVASGNITADPSSQGQVGAPASGRIAELFVAPGVQVGRGQPLARLHSTELTRARSDYEHALLRLQLATRTLEQRRQLMRLGDATQRPVEEARYELSTAVSEEEVAHSNLELATRKLERVRDLYRNGVSTQQELDEAEAAREQAQSRQHQAQRQLAVARQHSRREERLVSSGSLVGPKILEAENELQLAREEVEHSRVILCDLGLTPGSKEDGLVLRAPRSGLVVASHTTMGQAVTADQCLFELLDPSTLWLWIYLYEKDQGKIRTGMPVQVEVDAIAGQHFKGHISYLPPNVEVPSRALRARVVVENRQGKLKVGMSARARISLGKSRQAVMIPAEALLGSNQVYVQGDSGYQARTVVAGSTDAKKQWVEIRQGIAVGEAVVTNGAYLLEAGGGPK